MIDVERMLTPAGPIAKGGTDAIEFLESGVQPSRLPFAIELVLRAQAIVAHELAEHEYGGDHELALIAGAETELPVSVEAKELLRRMERGWRGR